MMRIRLASATLTVVLLLAGCAGSPDPEPSATLTSAPPPTVSAEFGSIEGLVLSEEEAPIAGAAVALQEPSMEAVSDETGKFVFNNLTPGKHQVFASRLGFTSAAKSVDVTAGEVAQVKLLLKAISLDNESFHVTLTFEGFIECSASAFSPVNCASATDQTTNSWIVDVDRTYPLKEAVIELVWQQSSPASGNEMEIEFCDDLENRQVLCAQGQVDAWYTYADGPSPVVLRESSMPKEATQLLVGAGAKFGAQPIIQQRFTEYVTWCYVEKCAEDFTAQPPPA